LPTELSISRPSPSGASYRTPRRWSCRAYGIGEVDVGWGDLQIEATVDLAEDTAYHDVTRDLFTTRSPPLLARLFAETLGSIPLPRFDLSAVAGFPAGTVWELRDGVIARETPGSNIDLEDYYRLTGSLR
jgi:hypothetical protein